MKVANRFNIFAFHLPSGNLLTKKILEIKMELYELYNKHTKKKEIPFGMTEANLMNLQEFEKAIAELTEQQARSNGNASYKEPADKWIKVEENLPDVNGEYITYSYVNDVVECLVYENGSWKDYTGDEIITIDDVTHWMPLPGKPVSL